MCDLLVADVLVSRSETLDDVGTSLSNLEACETHLNDALSLLHSYLVPKVRDGRSGRSYASDIGPRSSRTTFSLSLEVKC